MRPKSKVKYSVINYAYKLFVMYLDTNKITFILININNRFTL